MTKLKKATVALVYDRANTIYGGAEQVIEALWQIYPDAPLFTSVHHSKRAIWAKNHQVITSFLQFLPLANTHHQWLATFMPLAFEQLNLSKFDILISITSAEAKGIYTNPKQLHVCYLLTPPRYLYNQQELLLNNSRFLKLPVIKQVAQVALNYLKWWDQSAAARPDFMIPIADVVRDRAQKYYGIKTEKTIYPPIKKPISVETIEIPPELSQQLKPIKDFYLFVGRLVPYKRVDLAIEACTKLKQTLIIVGKGTEKESLKEMAAANEKIIFLEQLSDENLAWLYTNATALLMPGEDDFGLVALEANAYGTPVIVFNKSGASEVIKEGVHGLHLLEQTTPALVEAMLLLKSFHFERSLLVKNALKYDTNRFVREFSNKIESLWRAHIKEL